MILLAEAENASKLIPDSGYPIWIVAVLGAGALFGAFWRMNGGGGPQNLRAVGLVLVATFASLLAVHERGSVTTAFGILGAIAGYLFGVQDSSAGHTQGGGAGQ